MVKDKLAEVLNFFEPVELKNFDDTSFLNDAYSLGSNLLINSLSNPLQVNAKFELALVFIRKSHNVDAKSSAPQAIREELYKLKRTSGLRIADLGDLRTGKNFNETLYAVQEVCALLFHLNVNVVIVGADQLLTLGTIRGYKEFENNINLINIDSKLDISSSPDSMEESNYLDKVIENDLANIYSIVNLGYQSYFVDSKQLKRLNELYFEQHRLGEVRSNIENMEPVLRDADLVSFDISAVRMNEAPGQKDGSPNGLFADEACRISRYCGISDRVKLFGLYEIDIQSDLKRQTAKLGAQILWYYFEGYLNRKHDYPKTQLSNYTKYEVQIDEIDFPIVFYKSDLTNRWWLKVQVKDNEGVEVESVVVSCSESDYLKACRNDIPDRWWINFKKLK